MQHCQCMIQQEAGGSSGHMPFYNSLLSGLRMLLLLLEKERVVLSRFDIAAANHRDLLWVPVRHLPTSALIPWPPPSSTLNASTTDGPPTAHRTHGVCLDQDFPTYMKYCHSTCKSVA
jgi:hypothetical protein